MGIRQIPPHCAYFNQNISLSKPKRLTKGYASVVSYSPLIHLRVLNPPYDAPSGHSVSHIITMLYEMIITCQHRSIQTARTKKLQECIRCKVAGFPNQMIGSQQATLA